MARHQVEAVTVQMKCIRCGVRNCSRLGRTLAFQVPKGDGGGFYLSDELVEQQLVPGLLEDLIEIRKSLHE